MGLCHGKGTQIPPNQSDQTPLPIPNYNNNNNNSPVKHIRALLARRHTSVTPYEPSLSDSVAGLDKNFGFSRQFVKHYELGDEIGRGYFGYTCSAKGNKGTMKGLEVAVKLIPKSKMTTAIAIQDVRREVSILRGLTGHKNLVQYYDAFEDDDNVYIVMELCKGGQLLDSVLQRGGKYSEDEAKAVMVQILSVVAYFHLQGVAHRDLKLENFLFTSKEDNSTLKAIDFGLSDYVKPDERLIDIVGNFSYAAPEVLHRSYGTEADMWSIGVIAYMLLTGSRPFWSRTESGILRAVLKADPDFDEAPWPSLSADATDFVKRLLNKDYRKRLTASQALNHPWLANYQDIKIPLDIKIYKQVKAYIFSSSLRKAALKALAKTLTVPQLAYFKGQYQLLGSTKHGSVCMQDFKTAVIRCSNDAMKAAWVLEYARTVSSLHCGKFNFDEFCAAAISVHQIEAMESWEKYVDCAYELFDKDGNRPIMIEELASELGLGPSVPVGPVHMVPQDWIRHSDGKLSFIGFVRLLGVSSHSFQKIYSNPI